jgi:hypothetical protein
MASFFLPVYATSKTGPGGARTTYMSVFKERRDEDIINDD